jgi:hypothetical protein
MEAADADQPENVSMRLQIRANVNLKDKSGDSAWDLTSSDEIEALLENYGGAEKDQN